MRGHPQPEGVLLTFHGGEQYSFRHDLVAEAWSVDASHHLVGECSREMLIGNRDFPPLPKRAYAPHRRRNHPLVEARDTQALAQALSGHTLGARSVGDPERILVSAGQTPEGFVHLSPTPGLTQLRHAQVRVTLANAVGLKNFFWS